MENIRLTFIAETKTVSVNGEEYVVNLDKIEPENLRAIQWYGTSKSPWGEIEYDGANNENFFDAALIRPIYAKWLEAKEKFEKEQEAAKEKFERENSTYDILRQKEYPSIHEQVGAIISWIDSVTDSNGILLTEEMKDIIERIRTVKDKYPKEETKSVKKKKTKK